jgi:hypothetical protein
VFIGRGLELLGGEAVEAVRLDVAEADQRLNV